MDLMPSYPPMNETPTATDDISAAGNGKKIFAGLSLLFVALLVGTLGFAYQLVQNPQPVEPPAHAQISQQPQITASPKVAGATIVAPWAYAASEISPAPALPSVSELDALYQKVRATIDARDYTAFKSLASTQRVWSIDNSNQATGKYTDDEIAITESKDPKGEANFVENAVIGILFNAPPVSDVTAVSVAMRPFTDTDRKIEVIDPVTNETNIVSYTPWRYTVDVTYETKPSALDQGKGTITFVYDKNKWAYQGDFWNLTTHKTSKTLGDAQASVSKTYDMSLSPTLDQNLTVSVGQAVAWKNVVGRIVSVSPSTSVWSSPYMSHDTFVKKFTQAGTYSYEVQDISGTMMKVYKGMIYVQ